LLARALKLIIYGLEALDERSPNPHFDKLLPKYIDRLTIDSQDLTSYSSTPYIQVQLHLAQLTIMYGVAVIGSLLGPTIDGGPYLGDKASRVYLSMH
jgi:hypothetical protein